MTKNLSIVDRFLLYVDKKDVLDGCWIWTGAKTHRGYGYFTINHKTYKSHRVSFELFIGPIPDGMCVCHSCDVPSCVNPAHLWLGTYQDNMKDRDNKGRQSHHTRNRGENQGLHKLTEQNIYKIREMLEQEYTQQEIANIFGVKKALISKIKHGMAWGWLK